MSFVTAGPTAYFPEYMTRPVAKVPAGVNSGPQFSYSTFPASYLSPAADLPTRAVSSELLSASAFRHPATEYHVIVISCCSTADRTVRLAWHRNA